MLKNIKTMLATLSMASLLLVPAFMMAVPAAAQSASPSLCQGINFASGTDGDECGADGEADGAVQNIIQTIVDLFSIVVGAVSVIMIIIGGLRYITSSGDSGNVQAAKNTILYAIVGLVIVIFAQTIVAFVVDRVTGNE